ncbi:MAG TPA: energy transducer TonB [bacterium]|nr:energy transducer TonB [bacterium]
MGLREYLNRMASPWRWKVSALLAFGLHALIFLGGGMVMATQAEYGMAGAMAMTGGKPRVQPPQEEMVDLEDDPEAPAEAVKKLKPVPTPVVPPGTGGTASGGALEVPSYYRNPPPPYPQEARERKQEGKVLLRVEVGADGKVLSVAVLRSSGFPLLDDSAQRTVSGWEFKPARMMGMAVANTVRVPVLFRLQDAR